MYFWDIYQCYILAKIFPVTEVFKEDTIKALGERVHIPQLGTHDRVKESNLLKAFLSI